MKVNYLHNGTKVQKIVERQKLSTFNFQLSTIFRNFAKVTEKLMAQGLTQIQEQKLTQEQQQRLNAQQVMIMRLLEMPIAQLEQNVQTEMDENPALEGDNTNVDVNDNINDSIEGESETGEQEERKDELDEVLDRMDRDDRMDISDYERTKNYDPDADQEERIFGNIESFYDCLHDQVHEHSLTERQEMIMDYLIGNLDGDGLLRKDLAQLSDEIAVHEYIDVSEDEIEKVLTILQSFDPAGVGAQSLQQCLLIQIFRKNPTPLTKLMHRVIDECYDDFTHKKWNKICQKLDISERTAEEVLAEIKKLNPRPGASLSETIGRNTQQVTPDFVVESDEDGNLSFTLTKGRVPDLYVSRDFQEMIEAYRQNPTSMTRRDKEALVYAQQKMSRAQLYIEAVRQRQRTMSITMKALLKRQRAYFLSGDDSDLKPMVLKDVAEDTGFDISTISRVCNSKYVDTPWGGTIQLRSLFSHSFNTESGEEVSTREVKNVLRELIEGEPADKPLSDFKLATEMSKRGYPIARRTVAKYREQMGIPISSLRK